MIWKGMVIMKLISFGTTRLLKEKFVGKSPILSASINKPSRAVWACEYIPNIDNKEYHFHSEWEAWSVRESFHMDTLETAVIFELKPDTKILEIDSLETLDKLYETYKYIPTRTHDSDTVEFYDSCTKPTFDYEKIAKDYDVVHVHECATYQRFDSIFSSISLASWDIDSYAILNFDCIDLDSQEAFINPIKYSKITNKEWWDIIDNAD